ncbi:hypothetical protein HY383_04590 [Candidatus Daviesbacteria bacterium]|nr:hypothetical protein [Candidatus Daviesbacteria bacterium]
MKLKIKAVFCFTLLVSTLILLISPIYAAANITGGPVGKYKFKAEASWRIRKINLKYYNDGSADKFALLYGPKPGEYKWGALNLPAVANTTNTFTVDYLRSDKRYYFVLIAEKNGQFVYITDPVAAIAN